MLSGCMQTCTRAAASGAARDVHVSAAHLSFVCTLLTHPAPPSWALHGLRRERLQRGLRLRLGMLEPHIASWPQALSLLAAPAAAPRTLQLYAELADVVWHAAGDTSADLSW